MRAVVADFETASACDIKKAGAYRYAEDPTTEILCLVVQVIHDDKEDQEIALGKILWTPDCVDRPFFKINHRKIMELASDPDTIWIAHNAQFEKNIWRQIMVPMFGFPDIPNKRWHDTQAVAAYRAMPQKLEFLARAMRLPQQKDMEGSKLTIGMSKPDKRGYYDRSPDKLKRVYDYCSQDIATQVAAHSALGWLPPAERTVWLLDQRINERGIGIDLAYVEACQRIVDDASAPLIREFSTLTGGLKMTQTAKLHDWLHDHGCHLPNLQKETVADALELEDEDDDEQSLALPDWVAHTPDPQVETMDGEARRALSIRALVGSASIKKLASMQSCTCADGRARGLLVYHGTSPGRWAGRLLQPHNFPRPTLEHEDIKTQTWIDAVVNTLSTGDHEFVASILGPPVHAVISGLRHSVVAKKGRTLLSGDYAGIQARVVLALAGQHDKTALMAAGADVYIDMACEIYKMPKPSTKDEAKKFKIDHQEKRQTGKNSVLGLGFQMGAKKFRFKYCKLQPLEFAQMVVDTYRKEWAPGVPKLWYALEGAAVQTVHSGRPHEAFGVVYGLEDGWLFARLPSGRRIWYREPEPTFRAMPWDDTDIRPGFSYKTYKTGQWITRDAFGGLLTENVVMGIERDIMVHGMLLAEKNGFPIVLTVHDELVAEPETVNADEKALEQIMEEIPDWVKAIQVPIAVDTWQGDRYRK